MNGFEHIEATAQTPLFIFGDHASKFIPAEFEDLGLSGHDLTRHIAWDIGTEIIIRALCEHFGCAGQLAVTSRLVIDLNRNPSADGLIPAESDGTHIPGNQSLPAQARADRMARFYRPYHAALSKALKDTQNRYNNPLIISLHSFTPKPDRGEPRETDIGLLVRHDIPTAEKFAQSCTASGSKLNIGMNKPYSAYDLNYTVDEHIAPLGLRHLAIELRQDHIDTEETARDMARRLSVWLSPLLEAPPSLAL